MMVWPQLEMLVGVSSLERWQRERCTKIPIKIDVHFC